MLCSLIIVTSIIVRVYSFRITFWRGLFSGGLLDDSLGRFHAQMIDVRNIKQIIMYLISRFKNIFLCIFGQNSVLGAYALFITFRVSILAHLVFYLKLYTKYVSILVLI
jgi:hypothetical protein